MIVDVVASLCEVCQLLMGSLVVLCIPGLGFFPYLTGLLWLKSKRKEREEFVKMIIMFNFSLCIMC